MKSKPNQVRIIGGQWRGRKISFLPCNGLRPTHDRIRETVFNWLQHKISGAVCLDVFSGSGALAFEAMSRGAQSIVMLDNSPEVVASLEKNARVLMDDIPAIYCAKIPDSAPDLSCYKFDIVFIDPPFMQCLLEPTLQWLITQELLADDAWVYFEAEREYSLDKLSKTWSIHRHGKTKTLQYGLLFNENEKVQLEH